MNAHHGSNKRMQDIRSYVRTFAAIKIKAKRTNVATARGTQNRHHCLATTLGACLGTKKIHSEFRIWLREVNPASFFTHALPAGHAKSGRSASYTGRPSSGLATPAAGSKNAWYSGSAMFLCPMRLGTTTRMRPTWSWWRGLVMVGKE